MNLKRAESLVICFEPQGIVVHNFLTKDAFICSTQCIDFLFQLTDWQSLEAVYSSLEPQFRHGNIVNIVMELINNKALIIYGSELSELDRLYSENWEWGPPAGFYHFSVRNTKFLAGPEQRNAIRKRRNEKPEPKPIKKNDCYKQTLKLPKFVKDNYLFHTMYQRRSKRKFSGVEIMLTALSDCLYSAKGITQWVKDDDFGTLPLTMTPSGGARNPYELYVYAKSVSGLLPGFYHYCGETHDLGLISEENITPSHILANQEWTNSASAIIFLTADFSRSSWKYHLAPAYRIVLIEAGFIGQNIALSATHHGLSATPTGAVSENSIEKYLKLKPIKEAHIISLVIGKPLSEY